MIDVLIQGRLRGGVTVKPTQHGKDYAIFRLAATDKNGDAILCACITFDAAAVRAVQRLEEGDTVAVAGEAAVRTWSDRNGIERHGLDVTAHQVMSAYHAGRKRAVRATDGTDQASDRIH